MNLPPGLAYERNFARVDAVGHDHVRFTFDTTDRRWPWLSLPPQHPVLLEKYLYFAGMTGAWVLGSDEGSGLRAILTRMRWRCTDDGPSDELPVRGEYRQVMDDGRPNFELVLFGQSGAAVATVGGGGTALPPAAVDAMLDASRGGGGDAAAPSFDLASPESVGLGVAGRSFVSPTEQAGGQRRWRCIVPSCGGFHPEHPFHTGTGDHVNSGHLLDVAIQAAHLAVGTPSPLRVVGGSARFRRFTELDVESEVVLVEDDVVKARSLHFSIRQSGDETARVVLEVPA